MSTGMGSFSTVGSPPWKPSWSRSGSETRSVPGALLPPGWVWRHSGKQETSPESSSSPDVRLLGGISMTHLKTHGCLCKSHRQETVQEEMFTGAFETHVESKSYHNPNPCCQKGADVSNCRHPTAAPEPGPVVWQQAGGGATGRWCGNRAVEWQQACGWATGLCHTTGPSAAPQALAPGLQLDAIENGGGWRWALHRHAT